jgi:Protein kinase domain
MNKIKLFAHKIFLRCYALTKARRLYISLLGLLTVFISSSALANERPFYVKTSALKSLNVYVKALPNKRIVIEGKTDSKGNFYTTSGPVPGVYSLEIKDPSGLYSPFDKSIVVNYSEYNLAHIERVKIDKALVPKKQGAETETMQRTGGDQAFTKTVDRNPKIAREIPFGNPDAKATMKSPEQKSNRDVVRMPEPDQNTQRDRGMTLKYAVLILMMLSTAIAAVAVVRRSRRPITVTVVRPNEPVKLGNRFSIRDYEGMEKRLKKEKPEYLYIVGDYLFRQMTYSGGVGAVYLGESLQGKLVAIKIPHSGTVKKPKDVNREADLVSIKKEYELYVKYFKNDQLFVRYYEPVELTVEKDDELIRMYYCPMDFIEGKSLDKIIGSKKFDKDKRLEIINGLLKALQAAHSKGVVHRDIKPANILLSLDSQGIPINTKLIDFGALGQDRKLTLEYASPEQLRFERVDHRSDLFSLGLVSYELFENKLPYKKKEEISEPSDFDLKFRQISDTKIQDIIKKMLRKDLDHRYQSADEILIDLSLR